MMGTFQEHKPTTLHSCYCVVRERVFISLIKFPILPFNVYLGLKNDLFILRFETKIVYVEPVSFLIPLVRAICLVHHSVFDLTTLTTGPILGRVL
jgi:hypothetical protein